METPSASLASAAFRLALLLSMGAKRAKTLLTQITILFQVLDVEWTRESCGFPVDHLEEQA